VSFLDTARVVWNQTPTGMVANYIIESVQPDPDIEAFRLASLQLNNEWFKLWQASRQLESRGAIDAQLRASIDTRYRAWVDWFQSDAVQEARTGSAVSSVLPDWAVPDFFDPIPALATQLEDVYRPQYNELNAAVRNQVGSEELEPLVDGSTALPLPGDLVRTPDSGTGNLIWWLLGGALVVGGGYYAYRTLRRKATDKILGE